MRTTVVLDDDVVAAVEQLRREQATGLSETLNQLIRAGLRAKPPDPRFEQRTHELGLKIDVRNVAEAMELLDGDASGAWSG